MLNTISNFFLLELKYIIIILQIQSEFLQKPYSQLLESTMEFEAKKLVSAAFDRAVQLLEDNKEMLYLLVEELLKREVLSYDDICQLFKCDRPTPFKPRL